MKTRIELFSTIGIPLFLLVSCSTSKTMISDRIYGTQSAWTILPTYTYYPTYAVQPTIIQEVTKIILVTETNSPTSIYSATLTPTITQPIILTKGSGTIIAFINQDGIRMSYFDLDTGKNVDDETSDIGFWVSCGSGCFPGVSTRNGAISFIFGKQEPSYEDCAENMFSETYQISYKYICFKTNANNFSVFKIILYCSNRDGSDTITFLYKTWKQSE